MFSFASFITISPAITSVSLLASAMFIWFLIAVIVGRRPIFPDTATKIISFSVFEQISSSPAFPTSTLSQPITLSASFDTQTDCG